MVTPRSLTRPLLAALASAAILDGCACDTLPKNALTSCNLSQVVQGAVKTDILFVVDDSGSMQPHQTNLANNLSTFINALKSSPVANDFQIGVTTTSVADFNGTLMGEQGCFVGPVLQGSSSTLVADFQAQVTSVGTSGSGKEQPLRAMKLALTTPSLAGCTNNAGFLRPGARLAVVILTDEDDNSESSGHVADSNPKTHNDNRDGVDYKFGPNAEDPISDYVSFLGPSIGRDVVLGVIAGVDAKTLRPTCGYSQTYGGITQINGWGCENPNYTCTVPASCAPGTCGLQLFTNPPSGSNLQMDVLCCVNGAGTAYTSTCPLAYDKADRLVALASALPAGKTLVGSICDASFANTLQLMAGLIVSPTVPLSGAPADPAMLVVRVQKPDGTLIPCSRGTDYTYAAPSGTQSASITFLDAGACKLDQGYSIKIDVICAG